VLPGEPIWGFIKHNAGRLSCTGKLKKEIEMTDKNQELLKQCAVIIKDLHTKWGDSETPFGRVQATYVRGEFHYSWSNRTSHCDTITIHEFDGKFWATWPTLGNVATIDIIALAGRLSAIAEWFTTEDWLRKVDGSIGMLKRIHKAISDS